MIKTLIVTDYAGSAIKPEQEADEIATYFGDYHGLYLNYTHSTSVHVASERSPEFIIMDYGGIMPGSDNDVWQLRQLCEWAESHPGKLVLIWTSFTSRVWKFELENEFGHLDNVLHWKPVRSDGSTQYDILTDVWEKYEDELVEKIRQWYGQPPKSMEVQPKIENTPGRKE